MWCRIGTKDLINLWGSELPRSRTWSGKSRFLIMSDHGFSDFRNKVHVNHWLQENDYLSLVTGTRDLSGVDWSKTQAYAVGLNSIYLNVSGPRGTGHCAGR